MLFLVDTFPLLLWELLKRLVHLLTSYLSFVQRWTYSWLDAADFPTQYYSTAQCADFVCPLSTCFNVSLGGCMSCLLLFELYFFMVCTSSTCLLSEKVFIHLLSLTNKGFVYRPTSCRDVSLFLPALCRGFSLLTLSPCLSHYCSLPPPLSFPSYADYSAYYLCHFGILCRFTHFLCGGLLLCHLLLGNPSS